MKQTGFLILIISVIFFFSDIYQKTDYSPDDTYIYMQYARNISSGNGFAFNPGEPSYGVTSPLWVFLLTIPYFLKINTYWFAKGLDLLFLAFACIIFFKFAKK